MPLLCVLSAWFGTQLAFAPSHQQSHGRGWKLWALAQICSSLVTVGDAPSASPSPSLDGSIWDFEDRHNSSLQLRTFSIYYHPHQDENYPQICRFPSRRSSSLAGSDLVSLCKAPGSREEQISPLALHQTAIPCLTNHPTSITHVH